MLEALVSGFSNFGRLYFLMVLNVHEPIVLTNTDVKIAKVGQSVAKFWVEA